MKQTILNTTSDLATRVSRSFDISVSQHADLEKECEAIGEQPGVVEVSATSDRTQLLVTYDVRETRAKVIQEVVSSAGLAAPTSFWRRMRISWLSSLDENRRDNAAHRPACCSKPPPGTGVKHHH